MGSGYFSEDSASLNLYVSFTPASFAAPNPTLLQWAEWFSWASEMLAHATEDQVRIGAVVYTILPAGADPPIPTTTDIVITAGAAAETNKFASFGVDGMHLTIGSLNYPTPGVLVHELGHHLFGLGDEYIGPDLADPPRSLQAFCVDDTQPTFTCVMQRGAQSILLNPGAAWPGAVDAVTNFCAALPAPNPARHGAMGQHTWQHQYHPGESCWDTMTTSPIPGTMVALAAAAPTDPDLGDVPQAVPVQMVPAVAGSRFVLALDRSWSMSSDNKIGGVRQAAHAWINLEALLGNELGIVTFSSTAVTEPPGLGPLVPPAAAAHAAAAAITPAGMTNMRAALTEAAGLFTNPPASSQAILLFSDGLNTVGTDPDTAFVQNLAGNPNIYTLAFGPDADVPLMGDIATGTGGRTWHVETPADPLNSDYAINFALCYFASELHSSPIAVAETMLAPASAEEPGIRDEPESNKNLEIASEVASVEVDQLGSWFELEVVVEPSATRVTFVMNHRDVADVFLYVIDPNGVAVDPATSEFARGEGHVIYTVPRAAADGPERWLMRARRFDVRGLDTPVGLFAFAENPKLSVAVTGFEPIHGGGDEITIRAYGLFPGILTGLRVEIVDANNRDLVILELTESYPGNGEYVGTLPNPGEPGTYDYLVRFIGSEDTIEAFRFPDDEVPRQQPGEFRRELRRQARIGPFPPGRDNDGTGQEEPGPFCLRILAFIRWLCLRLRRFSTRQTPATSPLRNRRSASDVVD